MGRSIVLGTHPYAYVSRRTDVITTLEFAPMPRYVVEREFPDGLQIPIDQTGVRTCLAMIEGNLADQVTWVHSYVSADKRKTFCVYDAPSPEAVRRTAARNKLPVARITEVRVLDPYFFS